MVFYRQKKFRICSISILTFSCSVLKECYADFKMGELNCQHFSQNIGKKYYKECKSYIKTINSENFECTTQNQLIESQNQTIKRHSQHCTNEIQLIEFKKQSTKII